MLKLKAYFSEIIVYFFSIAGINEFHDVKQVEYRLNLHHFAEIRQSLRVNLVLFFDFIGNCGWGIAFQWQNRSQFRDISQSEAFAKLAK
jgi:hypothetical protein